MGQEERAGSASVLRPAVTGSRERLPSAFLRLTTGQGLSMLGDSFRFLTLMLWVYDQSSGSATYLGVAVIAQMLPQIVLGPLAGAFTDRADKIKVMIASDMARFILGLVLVAMVVSGNLPLALMVAAVSSAAGAVSQPAVRTAIHSIVPAGSLTRANSIFKVVEQTTFLVGPATAALAYVQWGPTAALTADALSYLVAAVVVLGLSVAATPQAVQRSNSLLADSKSGLRHVLDNPTLRSAVGVYACLGLVAGTMQTIMIAFLARDLHVDPGWVGAIALTNGVAQVAVGAAMIAFVVRIKPGRMVTISSAVMAAGGLVVAGAPNLVVLLAAILVIALGNMPFNVALTGLQQTIPDAAFRGRTVGVFEAVGGLGFLIAAQLSGIGADAWTPRWVLLAAAGAMLLGAALSVRLRHAGEPPTVADHV